MQPLDPAKVWLSSTISVAQYRCLEVDCDRPRIAQFVRERFSERYLNPVEVSGVKKSGFAMMAVACLMIEALESFSRGWPHTEGRSELAFCSFFARWPAFAQFRPYAESFYRYIRCGILHQAETTGGWRIHRKGELLNAERRIINASRFLKTLREVLDAYCRDLESKPWDSEIWVCFRRKMKAVCRNALGPAT